MDIINQFVSVETQAAILQILGALSLIMPLLEKLAAKTSNTVDDQAVGVLQKILAVVPRVRAGGGK